MAAVSGEVSLVGEGKMFVWQDSQTGRYITYPRILLYMDNIDYTVMEDDELITAKVVQEVHPISAELPIGTLTFSIYTTDPKYSMFQSGSYFQSLSRRLPILAYEVVNGVEYLIGKYYLDDWGNLSEYEFQFKAVDLIGLLEREDFTGLYYETAETVNNILADFLPDITSDYTVDSTLGAKTLQGWIKPGTYRDALRQVLFACQGAAVTDKSDKIIIKPSRYPINDDIYDYHIDRFKIVQGRSVELLPEVSSVDILAHDWEASTLEENLFEGDVAIGTYRLKFSEPYYDYEVTGVTNSIVASGVNYIEINVTAAGKMVVIGKPYLDVPNSYYYENPQFIAGNKRNDLIVKEAYLLSSGLIAAGLAEDTIVYYMQRHLQKCAVYGVNSKPVSLLDMPIVDTISNTTIRGIIEKKTIDLTAGFRTDMEIVGIEHIVGIIYIGLEDGVSGLSTEDERVLIVKR